MEIQLGLKEPLDFRVSEKALEFAQEQANIMYMDIIDTLSERKFYLPKAFQGNPFDAASMKNFTAAPIFV